MIEIDGEQAYPIWRISARWSHEGEHRPDCPKWHENLPEGRVWDATSFYKMFREEVTVSVVEATAREWWLYPNEKKGDKPADPVIILSFLRHETWCLSWFQHWTFDVGQSDEEALSSFSRFVDRMEELNRRETTHENGIEHPAYCLMGAEERWRWRGDPRKPDSPPPCRCEFCKEQGVLRIGH